MPNQVSFKVLPKVLLRIRSYWLEHLGAIFKVGEETDLAAFDAEVEAFEKSLRRVKSLKKQLRDAMAERNRLRASLVLLVSRLKKQVQIVKGRGSPELAAFPDLYPLPNRETEAGPLGPSPGTTTG